MKLYDQGEQLKRIADALDTIIKMVKADQEAQRVNCQFRMILKIILKKKVKSAKPQAASNA